jgi:hypothetical protein
VALTSGSASALGSIKDITPAIIAAGADAIKTVYAEAFKLVFLASLAFGGKIRTIGFLENIARS